MSLKPESHFLRLFKSALSKCSFICGQTMNSVSLKSYHWPSTFCLCDCGWPVAFIYEFTTHENHYDSVIRSWCHSHRIITIIITTLCVGIFVCVEGFFKDCFLTSNGWFLNKKHLESWKIFQDFPKTFSIFLFSFLFLV